MNDLKRLWVGVALVGCLLTASPAVRAQGIGLGVASTPGPVIVSNTITYSIFVTNFVALTTVFVTNSFSDDLLLVDQTNNVGAVVIPTDDGVAFQFDAQLAQIELVVSALNPGSFTNTITVGVFQSASTYTTNIVTEVKFPDGDLAVGLTNSATTVLTNDGTRIGLFVTNLGATTISGVILSNELPASLYLYSVTPTNASYSYSGSNLLWDVGTLTNGEVKQMVLTVVPTEIGDLPLAAEVWGNVVETNLANNVATNLLEVSGYLDVLGFSVGAQSLNRQTGLIEMPVTVLNDGTNDAPAVRLEVGILTNGTYLYNATGTNASAAYVQYNATVIAGSTVNFLLEFYRLNRAPLTTNEYSLAAYSLNPDSSATSVTNGTLITGIDITNQVVLLQFTATIGKTYTIIYADNMSFSNSYSAEPSVVAPGTQVQWIDSGPPKTISPPASANSRYYRVRQED